MKPEVEVEADETILSRALDEGLDVPHDCKLGVCMTCPARLVAGEVDQSDGMLSDDVVAQGYALLCAAYPRSDCTIRVIPEDELLQVQPGFTIPTGPVKPPPSGSGLPDRFDRKPVEFKSKFKIACVNGFARYTDRFDRCFNKKIRRCKSGSPV